MKKYIPCQKCSNSDKCDICRFQLYSDIIEQLRKELPSIKELLKDD